MKIKKVEDKPMVIHTRQKAKIHTHEPKQASMIMYEASKPVTGTTSRGAEFKACGFQDRKTIRTDDTYVHIHCYQHGHGSIPGHPVLLWTGQDGKFHQGRKKRL